MTSDTYQFHDFLNGTPAPKQWLRENLTMGECCVLKWVSQTPRTEVLQHWETLLQTAKTHENLGSCALLYRTRLKLIDAYLKDRMSIVEPLKNYISCVENRWGYREAPSLRELRAAATANADGDNQVNVSDSKRMASQFYNRDPGFLFGIGKEREQGPIRSVVKVTTSGWSNPALLMAGELLATLNGRRRPPDVTVRTRVMFAAGSQLGLLADLIVERVPYGSGQLIPDPLSCGYLLMDQNKGTFCTGIQNAVWAAHDYAAHHLAGDYREGFDWRWRLDFRPALELAEVHQNNIPIQLVIEGQSAETAFACALIAAHRFNRENLGGVDPLDPHVVATARVDPETWGEGGLTGRQEGRREDTPPCHLPETTTNH